MQDVIVPLWQLHPPPPPAPPPTQLHSSLQCCSLLNYYQRVWRDTCSLLFSHPLLHGSPSFTKSSIKTFINACPQTALPFFCVQKKNLKCASRPSFVNVHTRWKMHFNAGKDLHMDMHECICEQGAQMLLCGLCECGSLNAPPAFVHLFAFFLLS